VNIPGVVIDAVVEDCTLEPALCPVNYNNTAGMELTRSTWEVLPAGNLTVATQL